MCHAGSLSVKDGRTVNFWVPNLLAKLNFILQHDKFCASNEIAINRGDIVSPASQTNNSLDAKQWLIIRYDHAQ